MLCFKVKYNGSLWQQTINSITVDFLLQIISDKGCRIGSSVVRRIWYIQTQLSDSISVEYQEAEECFDFHNLLWRKTRIQILSPSYAALTLCHVNKDDVNISDGVIVMVISV